jgi:SAM-dependent MidA family methyltransferase
MINLLKEKIAASPKNFITYSEYMTTVLYDEEKGYYMTMKEKVGKEGDFYTNSNIHSIFSKIFAKMFIDIVSKEEIAVTICEIGAGTGRFAEGVIQEIKNNYPEYYSQLTYIIIESSPYHRELQREVITEMNKIVQYESLQVAKKYLPNFDGIIYSNELFDAFPVHVVERNDNQLYEICITLEEDTLQEVKVKCENGEIEQWLKSYYGTLKNGQRLEVPLAMEHFTAELSQWVDKGVIVTVDYGYTKEQWAMQEHVQGSLRGYKNHQMISNPLSYPGEMDLTTHIHFDALINSGNEKGLNKVLFLRQDRFLLQAGILSFLQETTDRNPFSNINKQNRAIRQFITAGDISSAFSVLVQEKRMNNVENWDVIREK